MKPDEDNIYFLYFLPAFFEELLFQLYLLRNLLLYIVLFLSS